MDLYLLSPPFLKKMMRRASSPEKDMSSLLLEEPEAIAEGPQPPEDHLDDFEEAGTDSSALRSRRRSSLDRMLRQHAYIIICAICYACNTLPSHMT